MAQLHKTDLSHVHEALTKLSELPLKELAILYSPLIILLGLSWIAKCIFNPLPGKFATYKYPQCKSEDQMLCRYVTTEWLTSARDFAEGTFYASLIGLLAAIVGVIKMAIKIATSWGVVIGFTFSIAFFVMTVAQLFSILGQGSRLKKILKQPTTQVNISVIKG